MKKISLAKNKGFALVDDGDFEVISKYKWHLFNDKTRQYAARSERPKPNLPSKTFFLHREIMGLKYPKVYIDHINHDGLDCRRENMRVCTISQNGMNRLANRKKSSSFKGVVWNKARKKWRSQIKKKGKVLYLGSFESEISAAKAYNEAAQKLFGEFSFLNQIEAT